MNSDVTVGSDALNALIDGFEVLSSGQAQRLKDWLDNEYNMSEEDFDKHLKSLGEAVGRDFGIL